MSKRNRYLLDGKTLKEFAKDSGISYATAKNHMQRGYAKWPRVTKGYKSKHPLYVTWKSMMQRCYNKTSASYKYYGARGVKVCQRWHNFWNFVLDVGDKPNGFTLDRIDNDGDYELLNCRWATPTQQIRNRRKVMANSSTGYKWIQRCHDKYRIRMWVDGKERQIGVFDNIHEAYVAREEFLKR